MINTQYSTAATKATDREAREKKVKTKFVMFIRVTKRSAEAEEITLKKKNKTK